jgi:hypothetical protein
MDVSRLDELLQFILAAAGQQDEHRDRELGPIHLIKYAYLADLAHAEVHGATFTGTQWQFYHFGPWSPAVLDRIDPALESVGAVKRTIASAKYDDFVRYSLVDERLLERLDAHLPSVVVSTVRHAVREFASDTPSLLRHVYVTRPMLLAAPGELLTFEAAPPYPTEQELTQSTDAALSWKARKQKRERFVTRRDQIRARLAAAAEQKPAAIVPPPRYDDTYFEGLRALDELAGPSPAPMEAEAVFPADIWKSPMRRDPDVP